MQLKPSSQCREKKSAEIYNCSRVTKQNRFEHIGQIKINQCYREIIMKTYE